MQDLQYGAQNLSLRASLRSHCEHHLLARRCVPDRWLHTLRAQKDFSVPLNVTGL